MRLLVVAGCGVVLARVADAQPASVLVPTLSAEGGYIETRGRVDDGNGREGVLRVSPGFRFDSRSGRLLGTVAYSADLLERRGIGATAGSEVAHHLDTSLRAELVPDLFFVDALGTVGKQAISPFGQQTADGSLQQNENRTTVATGTLRPYMRGQLGGVVNYDLRYSFSETRSKAVAGVDSKEVAYGGTFRSPDHGGLLGWELQASSDRAEFAATEPVTTQRAGAGISITPDRELRFDVRGGRETVTAIDRQTTNTAGIGFQWTPSDRTRLDAQVEHRYFGRSQRVAFSRRSASTIFSYSLTRDVTRSADAIAFTPPTTLYQLLFDQQASAVPDPVAREQLVREQLRNEGRDADQPVSIGFITSTLSVRQDQSLSLLWIGRRLTLGAQVSRSTVSPLIFSSIADPVAGEPVVQHGYNGSASYQLTPLTSVSLDGSRLMTLGTGSQTGTDLKSASVRMTSQLGRQLTGQLVARYSVFNSPTAPYRETQLSGSLNLRF
ncbi:MAG: TIGR03016 family PEP-CTERM system-associated outer membrane protein [Rubrivivax sp.]